jgi:NADH-quinone oxidoreductase subunit A
LPSPEPYVGLLAHLLVCVTLGALLIAAGKLFRHRVRASRPAKADTYECGEQPIGPAWRPQAVGFYLVALIFILFDAEVAFLFPWVLTLRSTGPAAFWGMVVFLAVLFVGWLYAWRKGDLHWSR